MKGFVYLYRLSQPVGRCWYYLGSTFDLAKRQCEHLLDQGSALLREANDRGIDYEIVAVVQCPDVGTARMIEAKLKRWKDNKRLLKHSEVFGCPIFLF